jgi:hypothetical protein
MTPRKTHYEMTKLLTTLSPNEINCIKGMKYIITNLTDKDLKILVKILLGNRYSEIIDKVNGK